ncbi:uncharacterized protein LOC142931211 [Petromyzon marinus]|uniref:uncharacterized protein LOC142931211 n=1 Tax=Petromyzon marinus TaxID=7757 RepID=UPI003F707F15
MLFVLRRLFLIRAQFLDYKDHGSMGQGRKSYQPGNGHRSSGSLRLLPRDKAWLWGHSKSQRLPCNHPAPYADAQPPGKLHGYVCQDPFPYPVPAPNRVALADRGSRWGSRKFHRAKRAAAAAATLGSDSQTIFKSPAVAYGSAALKPSEEEAKRHGLLGSGGGGGGAWAEPPPWDERGAAASGGLKWPPGEGTAGGTAVDRAAGAPCRPAGGGRQPGGTASFSAVGLRGSGGVEAAAAALRGALSLAGRAAAPAPRGRAYAEARGRRPPAERAAGRATRARA